MSCVGQMTHTLFHTHYSMVFGSCTVRSHASSDTSFSVCTHTCSPYVFIRGWCGCRGEQGFTSRGNSSSLISLTHVFCHIHLLRYSVSLRPFFLLCLSFYFSFNSQNMIYPLALFILFFPLLIYLLSPDHSSLCFYVLFFSFSPIFFFRLIYSPLFFLQCSSSAESFSIQSKEFWKTPKTVKLSQSQGSNGAFA